MSTPEEDLIADLFKNLPSGYFVANTTNSPNVMIGTTGFSTMVWSKLNDDPIVIYDKGVDAQPFEGMKEEPTNVKLGQLGKRKINI